ncbi:MmpS family transport accessory protein [Mycobacterium sp.]|uniref:MmpS family transport accessory protein n=1 Tax=Mycobacterium sp. TaxID=1785 RepID=UPI003A8ACCE4
MTKPSVAGVLKRTWIALVVAVVVVVAGFSVIRLRSFFGGHGNGAVTGSGLDEIKPFNPKKVVYEVWGAPGSIANINYLDINAQPQKASRVRLPWTLSVTTTLPSVSVNVIAQVDTDLVGCRIIVNDEVKAERTVAGVSAQTFCIVKSA